MQRLTTILLIVLLCLAALPAALPARSAAAASDASTPLPRTNGELLFATDFSAAGGGVEAVFGPEYMQFDVHDGIATISSSYGDAIISAVIADRTFGDFIAEVDILSHSERQRAGFGFVFRSTGLPTSEAALYELSLMPEAREVRISLHAPGVGKEDTEQLEWSDASAAYRSDGPNRLRLEAAGQQFTVFLNGRFVLKVSDPRSLEGMLGIQIAVPEDFAEGETLAGDFDNLRVYTLGRSVESVPPAATPQPTATPQPAATRRPVAPAPTAAPTAAAPVPVATVAPLQGGLGAAGVMMPALVTAGEARVYSGPGIAYRNMGTLLQGAEVTIVGRNLNCTWLQTTGELPGWIAESSLFLGGECSALPETASLPPTPLPIRTITARVTRDQASLKAGPGHGYTELATLPLNTVVTLTKRDASCTWLLVADASASGAEGEVMGWVKIHSLALSDGCNFLAVVPDAIPGLPITPAAATPAAATPAAATPAAATPAAAAPTVRPTPTATWVPGTPQILSNFEALGTWRRGDEAWGTLAFSTAQAVSGRGSALLDYTIPANVTNNYVVFLRSIAMAGTPDRVSLQVYGDGSGNLLNLWVQDAGGQVWQFHFGAVSHTGWQKMEAVLDTGLPWPVSLISGPEGENRLDYPISFAALVLDQPGNALSVGKIYLDDLIAFTE